jgi:translation initiation factor 2 alpha subunit (eIF-2alpha)
MKEGNLILCTVEKVTNTITFVTLPNGKKGTIISSEIAPGRIKLMRQYVVPNKKIVCKILSIEGDNIHLSLRRVNSKEKKEVMQKWKSEQAIRFAFKQILGKEEEKIIKDFENIERFIEEFKKEESIIDKYIPKEKKQAILNVIQKKKKKQEMKYLLNIKCLENDGVKKIKKILQTEDPRIKISYISAGKFKLKFEVEDFKSGKKEISEIFERIEKEAKKENCEFNFTEEK